MNTKPRRKNSAARLALLLIAQAVLCVSADADASLCHNFVVILGEGVG